MYFVPWVIRLLESRFPDFHWYTFSGANILKERRLSIITYSSAIGLLSHVYLDLFTHTSNPIFYPFGSRAILLFNDYFLSLIIVTVVTGLIFLFLLYKYWYNQTEPDIKADSPAI